MASRKGLFIWYADAVQFELLTDEQLGQLVRGLLKYSECHDLPKFEDPVVRLAFSFMAARDDRDLEKYEELCERRREAGKKGGRPPKANGFTENQKVSEKSKQKQKKLSSTSTPASTPASTIDLTPVQERMSSSERWSAGESEPPTSDWSVPQYQEFGAAAPTPTGVVTRHKYGEYGWVRLSAEEYDRLLNELGEAELTRCITYVDESAQSNGNKNKWKDWNLVIRKCARDRWGMNKGGQQSPGARPSASAGAVSDLQALHALFGEDGV